MFTQCIYIAPMYIYIYLHLQVLNQKQYTSIVKYSIIPKQKYIVLSFSSMLYELHEPMLSIRAPFTNLNLVLFGQVY